LSFSYHPTGELGDDLVLTPESTVAYRLDPAVKAQVEARARRNVIDTGRPCRVFESNNSTLLFQASPEIAP
jgi:hypothetical protein